MCRIFFTLVSLPILTNEPTHFLGIKSEYTPTAVVRLIYLIVLHIIGWSRMNGINVRENWRGYQEWRTNNPETLATKDTQDTWQRQKKPTTHKTKKMSNKGKNPTKNVGEPRYSRRVNSSYLLSLVATSADSIPSSYLVRITIAPIGTTFGNLQWRRY